MNGLRILLMFHGAPWRSEDMMRSEELTFSPRQLQPRVSLSAGQASDTLHSSTPPFLLHHTLAKPQTSGGFGAAAVIGYFVFHSKMKPEALALGQGCEWDFRFRKHSSPQLDSEQPNERTSFDS